MGVVRVGHAPEPHLVTGLHLERGSVLHVALGPALAVQVLVHVEHTHRLSTSSIRVSASGAGESAPAGERRGHATPGSRPSAGAKGPFSPYPVLGTLTAPCPTSRCSTSSGPAAADRPCWPTCSARPRACSPPASSGSSGTGASPRIVGVGAACASRPVPRGRAIVDRAFGDEPPDLARMQREVGQVSRVRQLPQLLTGRLGRGRRAGCGRLLPRATSSASTTGSRPRSGAMVVDSSKLPDLLPPAPPDPVAAAPRRPPGPRPSRHGPLVEAAASHRRRRRRRRGDGPLQRLEVGGAVGHLELDRPAPVRPSQRLPPGALRRPGDRSAAAPSSRCGRSPGLPPDDEPVHRRAHRATGREPRRGRQPQPPAQRRHPPGAKTTSGVRRSVRSIGPRSR